MCRIVTPPPLAGRRARAPHPKKAATAAQLQGADDYLTKPFTPRQLLASVGRFLQR
jgi:CheY-like chemotaxis protein